MKFLFIILLSLFSCKLSAQTFDTTKISVATTNDSIFKMVEIEASFPGGEQVWNKYVQQQLELNIDKLVRNKKSFGTCVIQFIVDKDGAITNVEALTMKNSLLAKIIIKAIKDGPKWVPAFQDGRTVKAYRRQKVTFLAPD